MVEISDAHRHLDHSNIQLFGDITSYKSCGFVAHITSWKVVPIFAYSFNTIAQLCF